MSDPHERDLIEIYKLHAELADRVSQRREGANRLYVTLLVGLVVFVTALLRFGAGDRSIQMIMWPVGALGALAVGFLVHRHPFLPTTQRRQVPGLARAGEATAVRVLHAGMGAAGRGQGREPLLEAHDRRGGSPVDFLPVVVLRHGGGAAPLSGPLGAARRGAPMPTAGRWPRGSSGRRAEPARSLLRSCPPAGRGTPPRTVPSTPERTRRHHRDGARGRRPSPSRASPPAR